MRLFRGSDREATVTDSTARPRLQPDHAPVSRASRFIPRDAAYEYDYPTKFFTANPARSPPRSP